MSYGIDVDTIATTTQVQEAARKRGLHTQLDPQECLVIRSISNTSSAELCIIDECIYAINIRGGFENAIKDIILSVDADAVFTDQ